MYKARAGRPLWIAWVIALLVLSFASVGAEGGAGTVQVWLTTGNEQNLLARQEDLLFGPVRGAPVIVTVDEGVTYQSIDGFGAAVTGSSAYLLQQLPHDARRALLEELFGEEGIGLSMVRFTIGSSDFSLGNYTYHDTPGNRPDFEFAHFSIEPDRAHVIPTLQEVLEVNPDVKVMGSPWSAPAWLKQSRTLKGSRLRRDERYYAAYAEYFARTVEAFAAEGIPVWAITVQNEPLHTSGGYPTMRMAATEQRDFIKNHLGPTFRARGLTTAIIAYDHNWDRPDYPLAVLNDPEAAQYVTGTAWHCYAGEPSAMSRVHEAHPHKGIYFTECSGGEWSTHFGNNLGWNMTNLIIGSTRNWAKSILLWNLALDPRHGPTNGGCMNCRGVVTLDPATGRIERNVEYYVLGHAAKFVRPEAVRIASDTFPGRLESVAFRNPDGSIALILFNPRGTGQPLEVRWRGQGAQYILPAGSVATLVWRAEE